MLLPLRPHLIKTCHTEGWENTRPAVKINPFVVRLAWRVYICKLQRVSRFFSYSASSQTVPEAVNRQKDTNWGRKKNGAVN